MIAFADDRFYSALSGAARCDSARPDERRLLLDALAAYHRQLQVWAESCPKHFENRAALVGAEIARLEGRDVDAMRLYERAIRSAHDNGFVHNEAIACERASDSIEVAGSTRSPISIWATPGMPMFMGEPMGRCGNSKRSIRTLAGKRPHPG
jgi:hypothetical protein